MNWLENVARRAGLAGAETLTISRDATASDAWAAVARAAHVEDAAVTRAVADHFRLAVADMEAAELKALKLLPEKLARRYQVFPLRETDRNLVVGTANPMDLDVEQAVGFASGRKTVFEIASPSAIQEALDTRYSPDRAASAILENMDTAFADAVTVVENMEPEPVAALEVEAAPVVQLTSLILRQGIESGASDIHIEPQGRSGGIVRLRVDGVMRQSLKLPMAALVRVVARIKVLGKLDIADRLRPQEGRARVAIDNRTFDLRISTVPTRDVEKAVIRILRPSTAKGLDDVHLPPRALARVRNLLAARDGIVVVTGPTGSGKTTTLYAAIKELARGDTNITTVEDPVEYELPGITQIQVEPKRQVTFASALRAILRQDPDVIFVGEIRDAETAEVAVQAAMTGHLVLATLHTNDAAGAVTRLADLGLDRTAIAASLRGVLAQRLVRRVCGDCSVAADEPLTPDEERLAARYAVRPVRRAVGCAACGGTGYRGRVPVMEVLVSGPALSEQVSTGANAAAITKAAYQSGMRPLREVAVDRVREGVTTLEELDRVLGETGMPETPGEVVPAAPPTILLVDDDPVERRLARALLEQSGYRVAEASDGEEGRRLLASGEQYAMVVLDVNMPRVSGPELFREIRGAPATASLPVVMLTGQSDLAVEVGLMEEGVDDYVRKPFDPPRFAARVKATLRRAGHA